MTLDLFKEILPSIRECKEDLLKQDNSGEYVPFVINTALSCHLDTLWEANAMNMLPHIPPLYQYKYLYGTVKAYKRPYQPWPKKTKSDAVRAVMLYFQFNRTKALEAMDCLTEEQINDIVKALEA